MKTPSPRVTLIAALDSHRAIGQDNQLPWHLPKDLKRFKELTRGKPVIMGRKTAQSLGRPLPHRVNIVLSGSTRAPFDGARMAHSPAHALDLAGDAPEVMIIGGGQVYSLFLPLATLIRLTWVDTVVEGPDAHFPEFASGEWAEVSREECLPDDSHPFAFRFIDYMSLGR